VALTAGGAWPGDGINASAVTTAEAVTVGTVSIARQGVDPWIPPKISVDVRNTLRTAVWIAVARIAEVESWGDLFSDLGADATQMLAATLYFPVAAYNRRDGICKQAVAYTEVGEVDLRLPGVLPSLRRPLGVLGGPRGPPSRRPDRETPRSVGRDLTRR
jgi:hypothetical protein